MMLGIFVSLTWKNCDMSKYTIEELAEELAESWVNGNRKDVIEAIERMPKKKAFAVLAQVYHCLGSSGTPFEDSERMTMRKMLKNRI